MFLRATCTCCSPFVIALLAAVLIAWQANAPVSADEPHAQPQRSEDAEKPGDEKYGPPIRWLDYDSEPPYDFYKRDWRYRMRTYRGSRFSRDYYRPFGRYGGRYHRYWGRLPHDYGPYGYEPGRHYSPPGAYGYGYGFPTSPAFDEGYYQGRNDGRRFAEWEFRYRMGTTSYLQAMETGVQAFKKGAYSTAAKQFILAAKLNQGDAASRLHAAHAMVALGRHAEAALTMRRALQLQPKLVYLSLDIRREYGPNEDFNKHYQKLKDAAERTADDPDLWFLLGYYQFFSDRGVEACRSLEKADALDPQNRTTKRLLDAARLSTPAQPESAAPECNRPTEPRPSGSGELASSSEAPA